MAALQAYLLVQNSFDQGRGGRAMGGWAFGETLRRRVRLFVFFAPFVAKCLFSFPSFSTSSADFEIPEASASHKHQNILSNMDITCLCPISFFHFVCNQHIFSTLQAMFMLDLPSFEIQLPSFAIAGGRALSELYNERRVL